MAEIFVDVTSLKNKIDELSNLNEQFKSQLSALEEAEATLAGMWEGPSKEAFRVAFHNDAVQMKNFYNAILIYVQQLIVIFNAYAKAESTNVDLANQRSYGG